MQLQDLQNRTWHLLREDGPDTGFAAPTTGDFNITVVTRDLNIQLGAFIGETGIAPSLSDKVVTSVVTAGMDFALPADLSALVRVEYTPAGQYPYVLTAKSFEEWDSITGGVMPPETGPPEYYRFPFAGKIRLYPAPSAGNAGLASGIFNLGGAPSAGDRITLTINGVSIGPYVVLASDTLTTIAMSLATLINASSVVTGGTLAAVVASGTAINMTAANPGLAGNNITYFGSTTDPNLTVSPSQSTPFTGGSVVSDTITLYYSSLGTLLVNPTDVPGIPSQFHVALVYGLLKDYWKRKSDPQQAAMYEKAYLDKVQRAKAYVFDQNREGQFTIAGDDDVTLDASFPY